MAILPELVDLDLLGRGEDPPLNEPGPSREQARRLHQLLGKDGPLVRREEPEAGIHSLREDELAPRKLAAEFGGERKSSFFVQGIPELAS